MRHWASTHKLIIGGVLGALVAAGVGAYVIASGGDQETGPAPAPQVLVQEVAVPEETEELGFPGFATRNTTRVAGADPVADAAGVALAVHPSTGGVPGPAAVTLVDASDWRAGIAAASLVAAPVGAPILLSEDGELPELTASAIRALAPAGSSDTGGRQAFVVGDAAKPEGFDSEELRGDDPAELAAAVDRLRTKLAGKPEHVLLVSAADPAFAMPAAGWAARSGDPVLFVERQGVPAATRKALASHPDTPVYVLGSPAAISAKLIKRIQELAPSAQRIGAKDPVDSAIAFARYAGGSFGWNINDPGHGLVIANASRPLDAAAAAPLSASGTWGPLLLTDDAERLPESLRGYMLDLKPGYESDPTRAVYNHLWLIGDPEAISVGVQAQLDELAEVARVR